MYRISTISDILRQGVDSLVQWFEHWISTPAVQVRIPSRTWDFSKLCIISYLRIFTFVRWGLVGNGPFESYSHKNDILVIINDYSLEMGVCFVPLHHSIIRDYPPWLEGRGGRSNDA